MLPLPTRLRHVLDDVLFSLAAWHLLNGLAASPGARRPVSGLLWSTDLDVTELMRAVAALTERGYVWTTPEGSVALAPERAASVLELCGRVEADRTLQQAVVREAARRECLATRVKAIRLAWLPAKGAPERVLTVKVPSGGALKPA